LNHVSRKSSRNASLLLGAACALAFALLSAFAHELESADKKRKPESQLAGLRPGKDRLRTATNAHGPYYRRLSPDKDDVLVWVDSYKHRALRLEMDANGIIRSVTVSAIDPIISENGKHDAPLPSVLLASGRGLRLSHNYCPDVQDAYGEPDTSKEVEFRGNTLEVLSYSFEKPPQLLEVKCERGGGKIVEMKLAVTSSGAEK
jgi:hypothetical protein